ncbi:hypothetical protein EV401DRAFT_1888789 [Pisolithus croceorrhizus]|nr:hypothetical protein EV401DRAFT_1888789 [Pisolithus croceorrhizus]
MNEKRTSLMPHHQICNPTMLRGEMRMTPARFREFTICSKETPQLWIETRTARPGSSSEIYDNGFKTRPISSVVSDAKGRAPTGVPILFGSGEKYQGPHLNEISEERGLTPKEQVKMRKEYPLRNRLVAVKKPCVETNDSEDGADSQTDSNTRSPSPPPASRHCSVVRASTDPELDFLSSAKPNLADFHPHFVALGLIDDDTLKGFFSWKADEQERMMRQELGHVLTPLQLYGLFVAMRERRELLHRSLL